VEKKEKGHWAKG